MNTLPDFRDVGELLALIDRSRHPAGEGAAPAVPETAGFLDCRGVLHRWDEGDA